MKLRAIGFLVFHTLITGVVLLQLFYWPPQGEVNVPGVRLVVALLCVVHWATSLIETRYLLWPIRPVLELEVAEFSILGRIRFVPGWVDNMQNLSFGALFASMGLLRADGVARYALFLVGGWYMARAIVHMAKKRKSFSFPDND